jgi:PadR family transcriptional regulator, regulatory protein AphA
MENKVQFVLLGLLSDFTMNGYELKNFMEQSISNFFKPSYGNIYPTLAKLRELNLIEEIKDQSSERTTRYHVTTTGYALFRESLLAPIEDIRFGNEDLLQLFFYHHLSVPEQIHKTTNLMQRFNQEIQTLIELKEHVHRNAQPNQLATLDYGVQSYQQAVAFYQDILQDLQKKTP